MLHDPVLVAPGVHEIPVTERAGMRVPVRVVADGELLADIRRDRSLDQLAQVATLPGIVDFAIGMPDMHEGYGFPVGGVAATAGPDGVISPGGIGFDINCGVRLLTTGLDVADRSRWLERVVHDLSRAIPTGYGRQGRLSLDAGDLDGVLSDGAAHVVQALGMGTEHDLAHAESNGRMEGAEPTHVSDRARERGREQLGTMGGGNHFVEVQVVDEVYDETLAAELGVPLGAVTVLVHTGSRGLGHQVCSDHSRLMGEALVRYGIEVPDRQLACAPLSSPEGQAYFGAMAAAANFAWANRQVLTHRVREVVSRVAGAAAGDGIQVVYDVAHNVAKLERYGDRTLCVHRKGATRAFGPGEPELPPRYRATGQPVFIPGSMGTRSFVLVGTARSRDVSFGSCCHGAGRAMSRGAAKRAQPGHVVRKMLEDQGIVVRCASNEELAEESPGAYKDVERVVGAVVTAGIARKVARVRPLGVLKG
jgi:tRNA-splicing ligase RtcB